MLFISYSSVTLASPPPSFGSQLLRPLKAQRGRSIGTLSEVSWSDCHDGAIAGMV